MLSLVFSERNQHKSALCDGDLTKTGTSPWFAVIIEPLKTDDPQDAVEPVIVHV